MGIRRPRGGAAIAKTARMDAVGGYPVFFARFRCVEIPRKVLKTVIMTKYIVVCRGGAAENSVAFYQEPCMSTEALYEVGPDDVVFPLMVYTRNQLIWGETLTKKTIRFLTLMRTPMRPSYIVLYKAKILPHGAHAPLAFPVVHIPIANVLAVHPAPPEQEPYDYDEGEKNRKFEPVTILVGDFRMDGKVRISTRTNVTQTLDVAKEPYTAVYDVSVSSLSLPNRNPLRTRMAVIRHTGAVLAAYSTTMEKSL